MKNRKQLFINLFLSEGTTRAGHSDRTGSGPLPAAGDAVIIPGQTQGFKKKPAVSSSG